MSTTVTAPAALDLGMTELEDLAAPGFWDTAAGVAGGLIVGYGAVALFVWT